MIDFIKINKETAKNYGIIYNDNKENYILKKDNVIIGTGSLDINSGNMNIIELLIFDSYQENGYGKILFTKLLQKLKEYKYKDIIMCFDKKNIKLKRIIEYNSGVHISTDMEKTTYVISIL